MKVFLFWQILSLKSWAPWEDFIVLGPTCCMATNWEQTKKKGGGDLAGVLMQMVPSEPDTLVFPSAALGSRATLSLVSRYCNGCLIFPRWDEGGGLLLQGRLTQQEPILTNRRKESWLSQQSVSHPDTEAWAGAPMLGIPTPRSGDRKVLGGLLASQAIA